MSRISTVGGIQNSISRRLNEVSADHGDRYLEYINLGMEDIAAEFPRAPWLQSSAVLTLAGNNLRWQLSSIATGVRQIYDVTISSQDAKLAFVRKDQFDAISPKPNDSGIPRIYTVFNDEIYFHPTPTSDYGAQILYQKDVTSVSAASAVPEIPTQYLEGIVLYGWTQGLYVREDFDLAAQVEQKFAFYKARMKKQLKKVSLESQRMLSVRDIQAGNAVYNDEITQAIWGAN